MQTALDQLNTRNIIQKWTFLLVCNLASAADDVYKFNKSTRIQKLYQVSKTNFVKQGLELSHEKTSQVMMKNAAQRQSRHTTHLTVWNTNSEMNWTDKTQSWLNE